MKGFTSTIEPQFKADGSLDLELMTRVFVLGLAAWAKRQAPGSPAKSPMAKTMPSPKVVKKAS